jgi:hypothetical protein
MQVIGISYEVLSLCVRYLKSYSQNKFQVITIDLQATTACKEVKLLLYMIKHTIKTYSGVRVQFDSFLTSVLNVRQYHTLPAFPAGRVTGIP